MAIPDDQRIHPGGTPQERNPAEVRGHDLEHDTETEVYTSESLTMWLRQVQQRRGEGQRMALACLVQNKSEANHRASHAGDGEDCDECNDRGVTTSRDGDEVVNE